MVAHLSWAIWANRSQSLIWFERNEQMSKWANERWANEQIPSPVPEVCCEIWHSLNSVCRCLVSFVDLECDNLGYCFYLHLVFLAMAILLNCTLNIRWKHYQTNRKSGKCIKKLYTYNQEPDGCTMNCRLKVYTANSTLREDKYWECGTAIPPPTDQYFFYNAVFDNNIFKTFFS